jgi:hypothetical protein
MAIWLACDQPREPKIRISSHQPLFHWLHWKISYHSPLCLACHIKFLIYLPN